MFDGVQYCTVIISPERALCLLSQNHKKLKARLSDFKV